MPSLQKLLRGFHNAKFVTLSSTIIKVLSMSPNVAVSDQSSPFSSLEALRLGVNPEGVPAKMMTYLLGGSPSAATCYFDPLLVINSDITDPYPSPLPPIRSLDPPSEFDPLDTLIQHLHPPSVIDTSDIKEDLSPPYYGYCF
ncbi:hypothetical protein Tsubulata_043963 [Turnera subulata]|uniref:Uncharacterized protein n=1 Tax=Turnera subulata TaxID=218843 RepID=A0A9Q0JSU1_9ROSI|nr:hypothetical protein Tsubulata_043963 [Turnera subulata]